jgi:hypothetical protein
MGFKAKARKHNPNGDKKDDSEGKKSKQGEQPCGIKGCENFSDKSFGGRSLSIDNAIEMWGSGNYSDRKGRVRVCKGCYRKWKKENKSDDAY